MRRLLTTSLLMLLAATALAADPAAPKSSPATVPGNPAQAPADLRNTQYFLGVAVEPLPPAISKLMKLRPGQGLLITKVIPDSPAARANLQINDLITSINGEPASSQRQLVDAANNLTQRKDGTWQLASCNLTCIREGEQNVVALTPAPRPADLAVQGNSVGFTPATAAGQQNIYLVPGTAGGTLQVGPGYVVDLTANAPLTKSIHGYMAKGQAIVVSQETDALGNLRRSVTVGDKTYAVDADNLASLPEDLRDLVRPLVSAPRAAAATSPADVRTAELEQRVAAQKKELDELKQELADLKKLLHPPLPSPAPQK